MPENELDMRWFDGFERALGSSDPVERLRDDVAEIVRSGVPSDTVQASLERFRIKLAAEGRDADEDVVLDVLDFLTGWCSPHRRID